MQWSRTGLSYRTKTCFEFSAPDLNPKDSASNPTDNDMSLLDSYDIQVHEKDLGEDCAPSSSILNNPKEDLENKQQQCGYSLEVLKFILEELEVTVA